MPILPPSPRIRIFPMPAILTKFLTENYFYFFSVSPPSLYGVRGASSFTCADHVRVHMSIHIPIRVCVHIPIILHNIVKMRRNRRVLSTSPHYSSIISPSCATSSFCVVMLLIFWVIRSSIWLIIDPSLPPSPETKLI